MPKAQQKKTQPKKKYPAWAARALQGITYWVGHRRCIYKGWPLAEAALVAEICNLIHANLSKEWQLRCEVQYAELLKGKDYPEDLPALARADLVVSKKPTVEGHERARNFVIEVKRASAPKAQIDSDLYRLAAVKHAHGNIRAFLFVISEERIPTRFVNINTGSSNKGEISIDKSEGYYSVIGTFKAASFFSNKETAQYACLLEVFVG